MCIAIGTKLVVFIEFKYLKMRLYAKIIIGGFDMLIKRDNYLNKLISKKWNGMIKVITGIRRCGKSYLLFELFKNHLIDNGVEDDQIIEISLDSVEFEDLQDKRKLNDYIKSKIRNDKNYYILLDEIQLVDGFELLLNGLLKHKNLDVYVTGSNSKFLSSDIITEFRGRGDEVRVHPLSFKEFYDSYKGDKHNAYSEYSIYGGMPALVEMDSHEAKSSYLYNLVENVYLTDIIDRNDLKKDKDVLGELLDIISSAIGSFTNPTKLVNVYESVKHIKINRITISNYLDCFMDAFLISKVQRYDINGNAYIDSPFKYYFEDIGLRNARINFRQNEPTHTMENIIYNELIIRGYSVDVGIVEVNYKDESKKSQRKQYEVDFVCNKGNAKYYIQSAYALENQDKINQETRGLNKIMDSFKKIVVVKDCYVPWYDEKGILYIGLEDFLLNPNSLDI